ncbi:MAG: hypothetical protein LUH18_08000 [Oscillospiraceae bacterium]|nr:hypothetical protein [Oscillospiraceae bacterium]
MNRRRIITIAVAITFAVTMVIGGGTLAYLTGTSVTVTNEVENNFNWVSITETEGEPEVDSDGNIVNSAYEIVPGTSQAKDPTVSVSYSLDSYVFLVIEDTSVVDGQEGLIDWAIASGWTKLDDACDETNGVYVYYRLVTEGEAGATEQTYSTLTYYTNSFEVLDGNEISYSSTITNSDLVEVDANGIVTEIYNEDIKLIFQAYIAQADISGSDGVNEDPLDVYNIAFSGASYYVAGANYVALASTTSSALATEMTNAISTASSGETLVFVLAGSSSVSSTDLENVLSSAATAGVEVVIDLAEETLEISSGSGTVNVAENANLTIANGTIDDNSGITGSNALFKTYDGTSLTLTGVDVDSGASIVYAYGNTSEINIIDSTLYTTGVYCVSTNASTQYNTTINIEDSKLTVAAADGDDCAVLLNVSGTLNITNSEITGDRQGVVVRSGTANISDSSITTNNVTATSASNLPRRQGTDSTATADKVWGSGNEVAIAALTVGNYSSTAYGDEATVTLSNVSLNVANEATATTGVTNAPEIFVASYDNGNGYASTTTVNIVSAPQTYDLNSTTLNSGTTTINYASYYVSNANYVVLDETSSTELATQLTTALSSASSDETTVVVLPEDSEVTVAIDSLSSAVSSGEAVVDLNGSTLTLSNGSTDNPVVVDDGESLTLANGTIVEETDRSGSSSILRVEAGGSLTLDSMNITSDGAVVFPRGSANSSEPATVTIVNTTINTTGSYGVATNAEMKDGDNEWKGVDITIENSSITAVTGVCVNLASNLTITNSSIIGSYQAVMVRAGTATITDSTLTCTGTGNADYNSSYVDGTRAWDAGNGVPAAALLVGNTNGTYLADADVTLSGVTLSSSNSTVPEIFFGGGYVYNGTSYSTVLTGASDDDTIQVLMLSDTSFTGTATLNGTALTSANNTSTTVSTVSALIG